MSHPAGSTIQIMEKVRRERNAARGRYCAKGTIPQVYGHPETIVRKETWFDRLRARIKAIKH